jgi:hypothetical protein
MANGEPDNPAIKVPPPLIYLLPLVLGLILAEGRTSPSCRAAWGASSGGRSSGAGCCLRGGSAKRCATPTRRYAPTGPCQG